MPECAHIDFLQFSGDKMQKMAIAKRKPKQTRTVTRSSNSARKPPRLTEAHAKFMKTTPGTPEYDRAGEDLLRIVFHGGRGASK
jgi:hypothetical protein